MGPLVYGSITAEMTAHIEFLRRHPGIQMPGRRSTKVGSKKLGHGCKKIDADAPSFWFGAGGWSCCTVLASAVHACWYRYMLV